MERWFAGTSTTIKGHAFRANKKNKQQEQQLRSKLRRLSTREHIRLFKGDHCAILPFKNLLTRLYFYTGNRHILSQNLFAASFPKSFQN